MPRRAPAAPSLTVTHAVLPASPVAATSADTALTADAAYPLSRALGGLWALNAASNPPSSSGNGCPLLPRAVPVAGAYAGMVFELDEDRFHAGCSVAAGECPYLKRKKEKRGE
jgi:hypothetical protein